MKKILLALFFLNLSTLASAKGCLFKDLESVKKVYVLPLYEAEVTYIFDEKGREAFYQVLWKLNEARTTDCFKVAKDAYPTYKAAIPTVRMDALTVKVLGDEKPAPALNVIPHANGHWTGMVGPTKISFSKRQEIERAIKARESLLEIEGDLRYRMTIVEKKIIDSLKCSEKSLEVGILNLYRRLGEINSYALKRPVEDGVDPEEVLQDFMGTCVTFQNVDAEGLEELDQKLKKTSRISEGTFSIKGSVTKDVTEPLPAVSEQRSEIVTI